MLIAGLVLSPSWGQADEPKEERPEGSPIEMQNAAEFGPPIRH